tara:strand:- start:387 stop:638 length:252 start_codon:yes stop_codon:yes gene_type:complete
MVRRADLLNKTKRGRILRAEPVIDEAPEVVEEVVEELLDLSTLKVAELRALCEERGLDPKGKKAELIAKLSDSGDGEDEEESE